MKALDRYLQRIRIAKALPFVHEGDRFLDIGCFDLSMLEQVAARVKSAVGVDPLAQGYKRGHLELRRGTVPGPEPMPDASFECIAMLAVLEHVQDKPALAKECFRLLAPGGRVVITVPRPAVDSILHVLARLRLIDGMSLEQHHGFDPDQTPAIFEQVGFRLRTRRSFELGLNLLFVFEKPGG